MHVLFENHLTAFAFAHRNTTILQSGMFLETDKVVFCVQSIIMRKVERRLLSGYIALNR